MKPRGFQLQFLIDPIQGQVIDFIRLESDLMDACARGASSDFDRPEGLSHLGCASSTFDRPGGLFRLEGADEKPTECPTSQLYLGLVDWLSQIVRNEPEVRCLDIQLDMPGSPKPVSPKPVSPTSPTHSASPFPNSEPRIPNPEPRIPSWRKLFLESTSRILLETSGSSGQPKQVWHTIPSLTRGVQLSEKHRDDVWGLTYPVNHLAGIQVLFQALLNLNPVVNLYLAPPEVVHRAIEQYRITHISCTPTFLRMILADEKVHRSVTRLTSGGERLDAGLVQSLAQMFPNAKLTNIYASTEVGSLLVGRDDTFVVPKLLADQVQVIDGELWLHRDLRVDTPSLTSPSSSTSSIQGGEGERDTYWSTGDRVEVVCGDPLTIRFVGREHEWFNVAGNRVDPSRLESIARSHPEIAESRFYGKPNSVTENLVACELVIKPGVSHFDITSWQEWFRPQVNRHEVPRLIRVVERIELTESGKVLRRDERVP